MSITINTTNIKSIRERWIWIFTHVFQMTLLRMQLLHLRIWKKFIYWMYDNNLLIKYGIINDTEYVCSKKYRYENSMRLLSVLEFTHISIIYRWINALGNGKNKIDSIYGCNKKYLKQKMAWYAPKNILIKAR